MSGKRASDQKIVALWLNEELIAALDAARWKIGKTRSQFIRDAIVEKLRRAGHPVDPDLAFARDRTKV